MKKIIKKIIAREFLFLLGTVLLFLIISFIWIKLIESNQNTERRLEIEIKYMTEREFKELPYQLRISLAMEQSFVLTRENIKYIRDFISSLKKHPEKVSNTYTYIKENYGNTGFTLTEEEFEEKLKNDKESENYLNQFHKLETDLEKTKDSIFNNSINSILTRLVLTLLTIFFLLRYLIYVTMWSVKQLRK